MKKPQILAMSIWVLAAFQNAANAQTNRDGTTPKKNTAAQSKELLDLIHQLQPNCIVNSRLGHRHGDYTVEEQTIPADGNPLPWESRITPNKHWGFHQKNNDWKPALELIRNLVDIASKGGNFLLNVAPTGEGVIPSASIDPPKEAGVALDLPAETPDKIASVIRLGFAKPAAKVTYNLAADAQRMAAMSPEELAWEKVLAENLGDFYLPHYKADKLAGKITAWDYVKDDPKLPRVLLIGDSISRGYTNPVRETLAGTANIHRAPANCGATTQGVKKLDDWLGEGKWDVIHFNFGIHDRGLPSEAYAANLEQIVTALEKTGAKLIWARTTPPASADNSEKFSPEQCEKLNRIADEIMTRHGIPTDDLCTPIQPRLPELQIKNNVHFNDAGYKVLARQVTASLVARLNTPAK